MNTRVKRFLSAVLALSMVVSLCNFTVFADEDGGGHAVSVTAEYGNATDLKALEVTDSSVIYLNASIAQKITAGTTNKLTIDLPIGVELITAPGVISPTTSSGYA